MLNEKFKLLHLEDNVSDIELLRYDLETQFSNIEYRAAETKTQFIKLLSEEQFDIVLTDYNVPGFAGLEAIQLVNENQPTSSTVYVSGHLDEQLAIECLQAGAVDYVMKSNLDKLPLTLVRILNERRVIKELRKAKEEALAREQFFHNILDNIGDPVFVKDDQSRLLLVNNAFCELIGMPEDKAIGKTLAEEVTPEEREHFLKVDKQVLATGKEDIEEETFTAKDHETRIISTRKTRFVDEKGNKLLIGIIRDITEKKQAEEQLKKNLLLLDQTQSIAKVGGWELDIATDNLFWTDETYRLHDTIPEEFDPTVDAGVDLFLPESKKELSKALREAIELGKPYNLELEMRTTKGRVIAVRTTCKVITENGKPSTLVGSFQDITKQKKAEQEIRKLSKAVEQSPVTVVITDLDGNIDYVNKKFEEVTGYTAAEAIGKNPRILKSGETSHADYSNLWATILEKKTWHGEFHNVRKDGSMYWESASIGPILNNDGEIVNFLAVKEDITKQKEAEKELKETLETLEELVDERTAALYQTTKQLEASTKDLISSMQYAKRIQEASIPSLEELQHGFADAFAMYLPKDIVSGDFYWKHETESEILIALVDCTGHGVPGALMSMAGNEALDNIIVSRTISRPDIILEEMDLVVKQLLRRKQGALKVADGMDMSVVHIDKSKKIFSYAGAQSHGLFISGAEVTALKPDRMSVGGISTTKSKEFKRTRINYQPGDKFYLFSDGYYDQFGEKTGKKLLRKVFTSLLKEHSSLSITEQGKEIVERFYSWKGNLQQIDDVTVLGFEL